MTWKKPNEGLMEFLEYTMGAFNCEKKKMFGCPVYFVNNNMFTEVFQDDIFIRLSESDREEILSTYDEATQFEPMKGRKMKEYVVLPESLYNDPEKFQEWLNRSNSYVSSLPIKKPKAKKKK